LPAVTHRFKGGRGIFTWCGYMAWLAFWPTAVAAGALRLVLVRFHQVRFSQYMIVLLPPFLFQFSNKLFHTGYPGLMHTLLAAILMGVLNFFVSKRKANITPRRLMKYLFRRCCCCSACVWPPSRE
jgi:glycerol-3-phosphate acyltransferase PlsY